MAFVEPLGGLLNDAVGHDVGGVARGDHQVDGAGIAAGDGHLILAGGLDLAAVALQHRVPDVGTALTQIHGTPEGVHNLLGGHVGAVVEVHIVPKLEGPDSAVLVFLPLGGEQRIQAAGFGVVPGQGLVDVLQHHDAVGILGAGIQGNIGCGIVNVIEHLVILACLGRAAGAAGAAAGCQAEGHQSGKNQAEQFFHFLGLSLVVVIGRRTGGE